MLAEIMSEDIDCTTWNFGNYLFLSTSLLIDNKVPYTIEYLIISNKWLILYVGVWNAKL